MRNVRSTRTSTLAGWSSAGSCWSILMPLSWMTVAMVRSERTMRRFFHQRVGEGGESLQERLLLPVAQRRQRLLQWPRARDEPAAYSLLGRRCEADDRAAAIRGI